MAGFVLVLHSANSLTNDFQTEGLKVHMNLMMPGVTKVGFFPYFGSSRWLLIEGIIALQIQIYIFVK